MENDSIYTIPGISPPILKNKLGITDVFELQMVSNEISTKKLFDLRMHFQKLIFEKEDVSFEIVFDENRLKEIHKYLFSDIYPFAGMYREENIIAQGRGDAPNNYMQLFSDYSDIDQELKMQLKLMSNSIKNNCFSNKNDYAKWLSHYFEGLIKIHPFRDGNGRTIKEFFVEFVEFNNKYLSFSPVELDFNQMDNIKLNNVLYNLFIDSNYLEKEFIKGIVYIEKEKNGVIKNSK